MVIHLIVIFHTVELFVVAQNYHSNSVTPGLANKVRLSKDNSEKNNTKETCKRYDAM